MNIKIKIKDIEWILNHPIIPNSFFVEKSQGCKNEKTAKQTYAGGVLLGLLEPESLNCKITKTKQGKPLAENNNFYFNISHSKNAVACAVANKPVGIDVQVVKELSTSLAYKICNSQEYKAYLDAEEKNEYLIKVWAAKEGYYKLKGTGITWDFKNLPFTVLPDKIISREYQFIYQEICIDLEKYICVCVYYK